LITAVTTEVAVRTPRYLPTFRSEESEHSMTQTQLGQQTQPAGWNLKSLPQRNRELYHTEPQKTSLVLGLVGGLQIPVYEEDKRDEVTPEHKAHTRQTPLTKETLKRRSQSSGGRKGNF
jgi:hypothetical protein